jgi:Putative zinc-finger
MSCPVTVRLGAYALGAADAAERLLVEPHLANCEACRMELAWLEPLPGLLARVPAELLRDAPQPAWPGPAGARLIPADTARAGRARSPAGRRRMIAGAAAAAALFAAGGIWLTQPGATQRAGTSPRAALTVSAANPVTHVRLTATLTRTSWGTRIRLVAWGLPLNQPCRLIIRSRTGASDVAGTWDAWRAGTVTIPASAAWRPADISSLRVATPTRTLVTVSALRQRTHVPSAPIP